MNAYHPVSPNVWDKPFRSLQKSNPDAQTLYLYVQTCRHRLSEGLYVLPIDYIVLDTGMTEERVAEAMQTLIDHGYLMYDADTEVVLDRKALKHFVPTGPKQMTAAVNKFRQVPHSRLRVEFLKVARIFASDFAEWLVDKYPELLTEELKEQVDTVSPTSDTQSGSDSTLDTVRRDRGRDEVSRGEVELLPQSTKEEPSNGEVLDPDALASSFGARVVGWRNQA